VKLVSLSRLKQKDEVVDWARQHVEELQRVFLGVDHAIAAGGGSGGSGGTGESYRHVQSSAATTWVITHGLSFRPNITAVDSSGRQIIPGAVDYTSATVTLTFSAAVGGEAYLS
jgi:hypothetical protein